MIHICRAQDGELFQVATTLWEIERTGNLELFLQQETGVDETAVIAYLSDGRRLTSENIRELAGFQDDTIFVFNKSHLDYELNEVLRALQVQPELLPAIENVESTDPSLLSQLPTRYLHDSHTHNELVSHLASCISNQSRAISIASRNLDLNILAISDAFESFGEAARQDLDKQSALLTSVETDLEIVARVQIHIEFMSQAVREAVEGGAKPRTLGDYVSNVKMRQVAEGCQTINRGLKTRFDAAEAAMKRLVDGSEEVRAALSSTGLIESSNMSKRRAEETIAKINDIHAAVERTDKPLPNILQELRQLDFVLRKEVETICDTKNRFTELCITCLRRISSLNTDLVQLPTNMATLQEDMRVKNSFVHIQRLHNMLYAYGATMIEIVRRKEFARFFYQRAQTILEVMAKLSTHEKKRRQIYRSEFHGLLPFDVKGMDAPAPSIDFSPTGVIDGEYSLERTDIEAFLDVLERLEKEIPCHPATAVHPIRVTRDGLQKMLVKMDGLESSFDRSVERSLLSASKLSMSHRRSEMDETLLQELTDHIEHLQQEQRTKDEAATEERDALRAEIVQLKETLMEASGSVEQAQLRNKVLERDVTRLQIQNDVDTEARRILEQRQQECLRELDHLREAHARALADATEQTQAAELLRQELAQTREEFEEVKALEVRNAEKVTQLMEDQTAALRNLEDARARGENMEGQIQSARRENEQINRALRDAAEQKDRLLRAQALEHERLLRDHRAEADGDRAVLEHQSAEIRAMLEATERQLKQAKADIEVLNADAAGYREEMQRVEHELREARHAERVLRADLVAGRSSRSDFDRQILDCKKLIAQLLDVAIAFRSSHDKTLTTLQGMASDLSLGAKSPMANLAESILSAEGRGPLPLAVAVKEEPAPIDPTKPESALEILRAYDFDLFAEAVTKVGSVIRKWKKQCKEYRDRAKSKITFRNFAKGDLALFLPTRNSVLKPWAAFNVSFPHYFLQANEQLAEQLKVREWWIGRITSLTERVADSKVPDSNPFGLGDGVKYYMLEVEDWQQPNSSTAKRRLGVRKASEKQSSRPPTPERPISPPLPESDDPVSPGSDTLGATRSPNSHLFPVRNRSPSSAAGPSSLSKLLASGPVPVVDSSQEAANPPSPQQVTSPVTLTAQPPSPSRAFSNTFAHSPNVSSPLRPGSRASGSTSSRVSFSGGIRPFIGNTMSASPSKAKAAPTTALSSEAMPVTPPQSSSAQSSSAEQDSTLLRRRSVTPSRTTTTTPSPNNSASDGLSNMLFGRRRTASEHVSAIRPPVANGTTTTTGDKGTAMTAASTLANLASGLGMSIGRRRKNASEVARRSSLVTPIQSDGDDGASDDPARPGSRTG